MNETATTTDRWTAAHVRIARRLFATCGDAGASGAPPIAALALTEGAGQFAWHAELFYELLPVRVDIDNDALVAERVAGADDALDALGSVAAADAATACVVVARIIVPRFASGVRSARSRTDRGLDGPRFRILRLVEADLRDAGRDLEDAAEQLLIDAASLDRAAEGCAKVERCLVAAGVRTGLSAPASVD